MLLHHYRDTVTPSNRTAASSEDAAWWLTRASSAADFCGFVKFLLSLLLLLLLPLLWRMLKRKEEAEPPNIHETWRGGGGREGLPCLGRKGPPRWISHIENAAIAGRCHWFTAVGVYSRVEWRTRTFAPQQSGFCHGNIFRAGSLQNVAWFHLRDRGSAISRIKVRQSLGGSPSPGWACSRFISETEVISRVHHP